MYRLFWFDLNKDKTREVSNVIPNNSCHSPSLYIPIEGEVFQSGSGVIIENEMQYLIEWNFLSKHTAKVIIELEVGGSLY
jgi:hypothetical protein